MNECALNSSQSTWMIQTTLVLGRERETRRTGEEEWCCSGKESWHSAEAAGGGDDEAVRVRGRWRTIPTGANGPSPPSARREEGR